VKNTRTNGSTGIEAACRVEHVQDSREREKGGRSSFVVVEIIGALFIRLRESCYFETSVEPVTRILKGVLGLVEVSGRITGIEREPSIASCPKESFFLDLQIITKE
jgi:hypothetical protein